VKNRFQSLPFKRNLQRYNEDSEKMIALEARCRRLQDELDNKDGEHERSLRGGDLHVGIKLSHSP
jgi:hypothetical protein